MDQAAQDRLLDTLTLRRWGRAEEVADLLCFLASDAAAYITGTLVDVSGGKLATQLPQVAYRRAASSDADSRAGALGDRGGQRHGARGRRGRRPAAAGGSR